MDEHAQWSRGRSSFVWMGGAKLQITLHCKTALEGETMHAIEWTWMSFTILLFLLQILMDNGSGRHESYLFSFNYRTIRDMIIIDIMINVI